VLAAEVMTTWYAVHDVRYHVHEKRGGADDAPRTMRVDYHVVLGQVKSEWVCFEHGGYAGARAAAWWKRRSPDPVPRTSERAVEVANHGGVAPTTAIRVRSVAGERYDTIIDHELGAMPEGLPAGDSDGDWGEAPF
jgi:DNA repair protein RadD